MALQTTIEAKAGWLTWQDFCTLKGTSKSPDEVLALALDAADVVLLQYVSVDAATINAQLKALHLAIAKKWVFDQHHGDTQFESKPQILRDYEDAISMLERYREGDFAVPVAAGAVADPDFKVTAKPRRFNTWFHD